MFSCTHTKKEKQNQKRKKKENIENHKTNNKTNLFLIYAAVTFSSLVTNNYEYMNTY